MNTSSRQSGFVHLISDLGINSCFKQLLAYNEHLYNLLAKIVITGQYTPGEIEKKWQALWEQKQIYKWDENAARSDSFVIDTPPPTVSGSLHMGHVFSYTQTDFIARFQRMHGKNVFYPMGFDDNGLPTERLVEKLKGIRANQMPREEFTKLCQEVVVDAESEFKNMLQTIALSIDWSQVYQTVSSSSRRISQMSFLDLYKKGKIERKNAPTFWDPVDQTTIAQAEIEDKEKAGVMNDVVFTTEAGDQIVIATTRPELICACVAVFFHPEDERYKSLEGKNAVTPFFKHKVRILADSDVDPEKGTGLVMCCTFGDIQDIQWWKRYNLAIKDCIKANGQMQNAGNYDGLYVKDARSKIIEDLKAAGLLIKQVELTQFVKCAERSGAPLEIITSPQWYIKVLDAKEQILEKANQCNWNPAYMKVRLENWVKGLNQDWCISRQRYFGVPFPAWYSKRIGEEGKIIIADVDQLPVDPLVDLPKGYTREEVTADSDVMDTWATSSISPQLNSMAINQDFAVDYERHKKLFPADLRPQAHEIIRTWAFYTIVKAMYHENSIPWKNLMISGWCLDANRAKMSKSKGNVVTPRELIEQKGADIVRYWASNSKLGVDIAYSEEVFKIGHRLCTKLWNASKFVHIHLANVEGMPSTTKNDINQGIIFESLDLWLITKLTKVIDNATKSFMQFEYCDARTYIEEFFWKDFCDNYLELIKGRIYNEEPNQQKSRQSAIYTLHHTLKTLFKLFAPFMPHIVEQLHEDIFKATDSIHQKGNWPKLEEYHQDDQAGKEGENCIAILELVRKYKSTHNLSLKTQLNLVEYSGIELSGSSSVDLKNAANTNVITYSQTLSGDNLLISEDNKVSVKVAYEG